MAEIRWAIRRGLPEGSRLARMLARKPRELVAVALANKMARIVWALMTKTGSRDGCRLSGWSLPGSRRGCEQDGGPVRAKSQ